jgi:hemerythrin
VALVAAASGKIEAESRILQDMTADLSSGIAEIAGGVDQISATAESINTTSRTNQKNIAGLIEEMSGFKTGAARKRDKKKSGKKIPVEAATPESLKAAKTLGSPKTIKAGGITATAGVGVSDMTVAGFVPYTWDGSLSVGHKMIDDQHKELFAKINGLLSAMYEGKGKDELKKAMDFLNNYTVKHFFEEEQLQKKYAYPDFENHHKLHEEFKATVREFSHELILKGISDELLQQVKRKIAGWLIAHIKVQDAQLGAFINRLSN